MPTIRVEVNGDPCEVEPATSVEGLVELLGLRPELVAVEVNRELVVRAERGTRRLADGDAVEIVTLVGGG